jgi:nicotinamidase-related amidase
MTSQLHVDAARSAVLSMDLQAGIVSVYVKDARFIPRAARVLQQARRAHVPIVRVRVGFRPGVPEASPRSLFLSAIEASLPHQRFFQNESGAIRPGVAPDEGDLIVTKSRVSAFAGTDLDLLLCAKDIHTLMVFGIATSGVVLSTVLQGADMDYRMVVIKDCCVDLDPDLHTCLVEKVLPRQAAVVSADNIVDALTVL